MINLKKLFRFNMGSIVSSFLPSLIFALVVFVATFLLSEGDIHDYSEESLARLLTIGGLGFIYSLLLTLIIRTYSLSFIAKVVCSVVGLGLLALYFFTFPVEKSSSFEFAVFLRFILLFFAGHLAFSIAAFYNCGEEDNFWNFNVALCLLFIETTVVGLFLFGTISIALVSLDKLFEFSFDDVNIYIDLFLFLAFVFHPLYFLNRFPKKPYVSFKNDVGLKYFVQYAIIFVLFVYVVILYAYLIKVLVSATWPRGWISNLILWYSAIGVLGYAFIKPLPSDNLWAGARLFKKYFFYSMIPLVIGLIFAIGKRVSEYGITEPRFVVVALAIFLSIIVAYFVISRKDDLRLIPLVLFIMTVISAVGPLNMSHLSVKSQQNRLLSLIEKAGLMPDGKLTTAGETLSPDMHTQISSTMNYLGDRKALGILTPHASAAVPLDSLIRGSNNRNIAYTILDDLGIVSLGLAAANDYFSLYAEEVVSIPVPEGATIFLETTYDIYSGGRPALYFDSNSKELVFLDDDVREVISVDSLLASHTGSSRIGNSQPIALELLKIERALPGGDITIYVRNVSGRYLGGKYEVEGLHAIGFYRR